MIHRFHHRRVMGCLALILMGYAALVWRLYHVQIVERDIWRRYIDRLHVRKIPIGKSRGKILSSSGVVLAQSIPVYSLCADPFEIKNEKGDVEKLALELAPLVAMNPLELVSRMEGRWHRTPRRKPAPRRGAPAPGNRGGGAVSAPSPIRSAAPPSPRTTVPTGVLPPALRALLPSLPAPTPTPAAAGLGLPRFVWIKRRMEAADHEAAVELIKKHQFRGLGFRKEFKRIYPNNQLLSQVLGFVGREDVGLEGLEHRLDKVLGGTPGERIVVVGPNGMAMHELNRRRPEGYNNVYLTIDHVTQYYVEQELDRIHELYTPKSCFAAVMDPMTGELLALASRPTFDPNDFKASPPESYKNRLVTDTFEPGSTLKVITAAAAVEDQKVDPKADFNCVGRVMLHGIPLRCTGTHGRLRLEEIIEKSCNSGIIQVGTLVGSKNLYYYLRRFGMGEPTGVDLDGEVGGVLRSVDDWSGLSIGAISIGQEMSITGLQMMAAISSVANGGQLLRPQIIKKITDSETGAVLSQRGRELRHRVISQETAKALSEMMIRVTRQGSGGEAALDDYPVAGKTGTSEKLGRPGGKERFVASFVGFLPARDPKAVIYVVLNEPQGKKVRGGIMAAPAFRRIAQQVMMLKKVPPEVGSGRPIVVPHPVDVASATEVADDGAEETYEETPSDMPSPTPASPSAEPGSASAAPDAVVAADDMGTEDEDTSADAREPDTEYE